MLILAYLILSELLNRGVNEMERIYRVDNLYDAIQIVKELPASEVFEIWKKLRKEEERKKFLIADLEKDNLMIYIENLKYYNPEISDLFQKENASGYEALNKLFESVALNDKREQANYYCNNNSKNADKNGKKIFKSFLSKFPGIFIKFFSSQGQK